MTDIHMKIQLLLHSGDRVESYSFVIKMSNIGKTNTKKWVGKREKKNMCYLRRHTLTYTPS